MPNYAVSSYLTPLGTHAEVSALLETVIDSLDNGTTLHLLGINALSRDRDRCIGYLLCDQTVFIESAYHVLSDDVPLTLTVTP